MYKTCHNRRKKNLFGLRTKLQYYISFQRKLISNRNEKTETFMNNYIYLGLSILELSEIIMFEFWYGYVKPKYDGKAKLYDIDRYK